MSHNCDAENVRRNDR